MDFSSRFSIYDFFSIVIPGLLILILLSCLCGYLPVCCKVVNNFWFISLILILSYFIGLLWHRLLELIFFKYRNNAQHISEQYKKLHKTEIGKELKAEEITNKYYEAYYFLMEKNCLNNIPNLEIKVAFIKNVVGIIPFYIISLIHCDNTIYHFFKTHFCSTLGIVILLMIIFIGLVFLLIYYQNKIYYLVWEGNKYIIQNNKKVEETT